MAAEKSYLELAQDNIVMFTPRLLDAVLNIMNWV